MSLSTRVDWRNYDYSEGPPKKAPVSVLGTNDRQDSRMMPARDTNPYSKSTNFRSPPSSLSPVNLPGSAGPGTITTVPSAGVGIDALTGSMVPQNSYAMNTSASNITSLHTNVTPLKTNGTGNGIGIGIGHGRLGSDPSTRSIRSSKPKLIYRPPTPTCSSGPDTAMDSSNNGMGQSMITAKFEPSPTSVAAMPGRINSRYNKGVDSGLGIAEPFDVQNRRFTPIAPEDEAICRKSASPIYNANVDALRLNVPSGSHEETIHLSTLNASRDKDGELIHVEDHEADAAFDNIWNDDGHSYPSPYGNGTMHAEEHDEVVNMNQMVMNMNTVVNNNINGLEPVTYEFESFAGDRSTATGVSENNKHANRSHVSMSEASIGQMDVMTERMPVSILRSSGKFMNDEGIVGIGVSGRSVGSRGSGRDAGGSTAATSSPVSGASVASSLVARKKRDHPWNNADGDQVAGSNLHRPMDEYPHHGSAHATADADIEKTNLKQYEANDEDIAQEKLQSFQKVTSLRGHIAVESSPSSRSDAGHENQTQHPNSKSQDPNSHLHDNSDGRKERRRKSRRRENDAEDDDTSLEDYANEKRADTLQDRTKQAWSKRIQAGGNAPVNSRHKSKRSLVSFQKDTVHEFVPEGDAQPSGTESDGATEYTDYTELDDDDTFAGRSMHSVYTKSNESEAEDFFKDLFFLGSGKATNPGRRQLRFKKEYKARYKAQMEEVSSSGGEEEGTIEGTIDDTIDDTIEDKSTIDGDLTSPDISRVPKKALKDSNGNDSNDDDSKMADSKSLDTYDEVEHDAFAISYNYCDDLINSLTNACGLTSSKPESTDIVAVGENDAAGTEEMSMVDSFVDFATNSLTSEPKAFSSDENQDALMKLSVSAAKTIHKLQDLKYDECHDLKLNTEVKVVRMSVGLPIGVVFAENDITCWVQRIFENGNAAMASIGDKVLVGDQLAAINGVTVMRKSVPDICRMLANAEDPSIIELTLVRYTGSIYPASNEQQGYEVIDTKLNKGRFSPIHLAKKVSFSRPKSPETKKDEGEEIAPQEVIKIKANKIVSKSTMNKKLIPKKPETPTTQQVKVTKKITSKKGTFNTDETSGTAPSKAPKEKKKRFKFLRRGKKEKKK